MVIMEEFNEIYSTVILASIKKSKDSLRSSSLSNTWQKDIWFRIKIMKIKINKNNSVTQTKILEKNRRKT